MCHVSSNEEYQSKSVVYIIKHISVIQLKEKATKNVCKHKQYRTTERAEVRNEIHSDENIMTNSCDDQ